ncbi:amidohydrolase family protein [Microbacterium sp.]|uniref:amidohydrolase family protein n=1 Tax=Microbacterium sp. TaxID=51671 RepID=UPI003C740753
MSDAAGAIEVHRARVVFPDARTAIVDGAVAVAAGVVRDVGTYADVSLRLPSPPALVHEWDGILTPGLVNAHTHLQYSDMAVVGRGTYTSFEQWGARFNEFYVLERDWGASAADGVALSLRAGTTAVAEIVTDLGARNAVHDGGLHGIVFWEVFGWKEEAWLQDGADRVLADLETVPTPPAHGLSPHALYSLDGLVLRDLADIAAQRDLRLHIHAAESASEDEFVRTGTGMLAERWRELGHPDLRLLASGGVGMGVISYLDALGVLSPRTHIAHGIYVDAEDRATLRERGVVAALCPRSNRVIGLADPPVADYLREGNTIAVGTDSLSSSPSLSVRDDMAELYRIARAQGYADDDLHARLFAAATLGGAAALGLDAGPGAIGRLAPGYRADLAVFRVTDRSPRHALAEFVEAGGSEAQATIVDGVIRHRAAEL